MNRFRRITSLLLTLAVLVGCTPVVQQEPPQPSPPAQPSPQVQQSSDCAEAGQPFVSGETPPVGSDADVDNILVTGVAEDVRTVMNAAREQWPAIFGEFPGLEEVETITIPFEAIQDNLEELFGAEPQQDTVAVGDLTIAKIPLPGVESFLPGIEEPTDAMKLAAAVTAARLVARDQYAEKAISLPVFAEVNLSTSHIHSGVSFDPDSVGAHPCGPLGRGDGTTFDTFWGQWALREHPGIGLMNSADDPPHHGCDAGPSTTQVVVFDTSAFALTGRGGAITNNVAITMPVPCPSHTGMLDLEFSDYVPEPPTPHHLKHHGLFVTALAYAVAPNAEFHLARVLDDEGNGYLSYLLQAMAHWTREGIDGQFPMVFNLSLGVNPLKVTLTPDQWDDVLAKLDIDPGDLIDLPVGPPLDTDSSLTPPDFPEDNWAPRAAMEMIVRIARDAGIVIVAASGNDNSREQYPAIYVPVLGVGASSKSSTRSCYSNEADVFVAAGSPLGVMPPSSVIACAPELITTCTNGECEYGVLSLIGEHPNYSLAFWTGTSFATPLVTGMVARRLNQVAAPPGDLRAAVLNFVMDVQDASFNPGDCIPLIDSVGSSAVPTRCILDGTRVMNIDYQ